MGKIYYLMGKSASGKDHIYENLIQETALDLKPFVLYTTRPIRSGEQDGREYFFVDEKRLSELREAGKIIEERMYSTVQGPWYYFTADDGQIDLVKHDYLGIGTLEFRILWNNRKSCDILNAVLVRNTKELQGVILCRVFRRL